jgi:SAM-dependent methyltransferase
MHPVPNQLPTQPAGRKEYQSSVAAEIGIYQQCLEVHRLPEIFHYWSNRHILPALNTLGTGGPAEMFGQNLAKQFRATAPGTRRFVSLGSGNCDLEILLALRLREEGNADFLFDCVDLNHAMLERGRRAAGQAGVEENFSFVRGDLNAWTPRDDYHAVIANQSLHHVVKLETLFREVKLSLRPGGKFIISDIIGRNGHLRWPEALDIVHEFWRRLPPSYRWNRRAGCYEELFKDHDCSGEGFEGVRSQDILPLLLSEFHFRFFFPFGNIVDPFLDRSFGPNFNAARSCDRAFIDQVHQRDRREMEAGRLSPAHLMAVAGREADGDCIFPGNLSPAFCVRATHPPSQRTPSFPGPLYRPLYQWADWPDTPRGELEKACGMLADSASLIERRTAWALSLEREANQRLEWGEELGKQLEERSQWALKLDAEVETRTAWALKEVSNRTEWVAMLEARLAGLQADLEDGTCRAQLLERELGERTCWAQRLERELDERTRWALRLESDLAEQTQRAERLQRDIHGYLRNPLRLLIRIATAIRNRIMPFTTVKIQI